MSELDAVLKSIRVLMAERGLEALLLQRVSSFAWATCGAASYINTAATNGTASVLITPASRAIITTNIEAPRLEREEGLAAQGWAFELEPWYAPPTAIARLTAGLKLGADGPYPGALDVSDEIAELRTLLTPEAITRFRRLGQVTGEAVGAAARAAAPGMTEHEIAARMILELESRGARATVVLVATDERIFNFRHPLPTGKRLERYAMLVACGRMHGLLSSITRLVHFGPLPDEVRRKLEAVTRIDALMIAATRPGATVGDVFEKTMAAYSEAGYPDEWRLHHQGGPAGYEPRELIATPGSPFRVQAGQTFAWNPSITGAKSEDTILVGAEGQPNEILTATAGWPAIRVTVDGQTFERAAILEL
ncbi:MAG: M24 family metallopeptidase [Anaerolineales bacterium]